MTTSSTNLKADRDDIAREYSGAPQAQQDLLVLLSEQTPPPAGSDAPPMPPDLLERLQGHYGSTMEETATDNIFTAPRHAPQSLGLMEKFRRWFSVPAFQWGGLVTACLAVILGVIFLKPSPPPGGGIGTTDQWRGNPPPEAQSGPLFVWIGSSSGADRAAVADKVPDMLDAPTPEAAMEISRKNPEAAIFTLDAAAGTVTVLANGEVKATQPLRTGAPASAESLLQALRKAQRSNSP